MDLLLKNLSWHNGTETVSGDIRITKRVISETGESLNPQKGELVGNFENHFIYPGLINAHDHLEMNLYPRLGRPPYSNYVEWAKDIYRPNDSPIREIEKVNIKTRLLWGGLKNLISGATTVVHHNPWHRLLGKRKFPVKVIKTDWAHSLALEKKTTKLSSRRKNGTFVIHAGEGTDQMAFSEIQKLDDLGLLNENTVLIHAVALRDNLIETLSQRQTAVVWCPASNYYMFDTTAPVQTLNGKITLALGSDSTLTGSPTLLHEMHFANDTALASPEEIYAMVTDAPARIFKLRSPRIARGEPADLFIAPRKQADYFQNLLHSEPGDLSLVLTNGIPRLKNVESGEKWKLPDNRIAIQGVAKYCDFDVYSLKAEIQKKVSREILESNALWKLIET